MLDGTNTSGPDWEAMRTADPIAFLPELWRRLHALHHGEGLSIEEVAEQVGMPAARVKDICRQIRQKLARVGGGVEPTGAAARAKAVAVPAAPKRRPTPPAPFQDKEEVQAPLKATKAAGMAMAAPAAEPIAKPKTTTPAAAVSKPAEPPSPPVAIEPEPVVVEDIAPPPEPLEVAAGPLPAEPVDAPAPVEPSDEPEEPTEPALDAEDGKSGFELTRGGYVAWWRKPKRKPSGSKAPGGSKAPAPDAPAKQEPIEEADLYFDTERDEFFAGSVRVRMSPLARRVLLALGEE